MLGALFLSHSFGDAILVWMVDDSSERTPLYSASYMSEDGNVFSQQWFFANSSTYLKGSGSFGTCLIE